MNIRKATISDATAIAEIYSYHILSRESCMLTEPMITIDIENMLQNLQDRELMVVAEIENQITGWAILKMYSPRLGYRYACESSIYMNPKFQGKGLGRKLMDWLLREAKQLDFHHIVAKIIKKNSASIQFHEKFGYTTVGVQKEIGFLDNEWEDVLIMQKLL